MADTSYTNTTFFDAFESILQYNAIPDEERYRHAISQVGLSQKEWANVLALKEQDYKGLGHHFVLNEADITSATYKNLFVYYNGDTNSTYNGSDSELYNMVQEYIGARRHNRVNTRTEVPRGYAMWGGQVAEIAPEPDRITGARTLHDLRDLTPATAVTTHPTIHNF